MRRVLVLFYTAAGNIEALAREIVAGVEEIHGTEATLRRVPDLDPGREQRQRAGIQLAVPQELSAYDALIIGTPSHFGNMAASMRAFLDLTTGLWKSGAMIGKIGGAFVSTSTQHGGQESTLAGIHTTLLHYGMVIAGVPYDCPELLDLGAVHGGSPYGAGTIVGIPGREGPSRIERAIARRQGRYVAELLAGTYAMARDR
jgi:NAD(P)H dehydrogenase (quinone)